MPARVSYQKTAISFVVVSMLASPAGAVPRTVDPLVALSVFGTSQSRAAVCAAGAQAAAAAGTAVAAQAGAPAGCLLPLVDAPPPVANEAPPPPLAAAPAGTVGALPLLLGLAAIASAAAAFLLIKDDKDGRINLPISPF